MLFLLVITVSSGNKHPVRQCPKPSADAVPGSRKSLEHDGMLIICETNGGEFTVNIEVI